MSGIMQNRLYFIAQYIVEPLPIVGLFQGCSPDLDDGVIIISQFYK